MPLREFRCTNIVTDKYGIKHVCNKLLGYIEGAAQIKCPKCGYLNYVSQAPPEQDNQITQSVYERQ